MKQEVIIKFKSNTERSMDTDVIIMPSRNQSNQQSRQIKKQIMRPLLSVLVILFSLHIFLFHIALAGRCDLTIEARVNSCYF